MELNADVVVIGGGPAGLAAAVAAARGGAGVLLVEQYGFLGGMVTTALVAPMMTFHAGSRQVIGGIGQEVVERLVALGGSPGHVPDLIGFVSTVTPFDPETLKLVALQMALEAGARLLLHGLLVDVSVQDGYIDAVRLQTKGGPVVVRGRVFVDCTGDGDLAARAGAPFVVGREGDGLTQPGTLMFRLGNVDFAAVRLAIERNPADFALGDLADGVASFPKINVSGFFSAVKQARANGDFPLQRDRVLCFQGVRPDEATVNMTRIQRVDPASAEDLTRAEIEGRLQVAAAVQFLRKYVPGFSNAFLLQTGDQVGLRESRRITGDYVLTEEDVLEGREFPDAVARGAFPIDIHSPDGDGLKARRIGKGSSYAIPYRCLLPKGLENLLVAGRCISTSHEAHASTRVTPTCFATGQAAGAGAALAVRERTSPRGVKIEHLQSRLLEGKAVLR
ncbi:MAG: FAD-dependent oxidoreductase [Firmicutes bacterium]|nr:FAD-dependent oxidoreductase [Bacillota bacterium]